MKTFVSSLLGLIVCSGSFAQGAALGASLNRVQLLSSFEKDISTCVQNNDTTHAVFHGCVDWHSAVEGHWAIFRIARVLRQNDDVTAFAEQNLSVGNLQLVTDELNQNPTFEAPYGMASLLRLSIEFENWALENGVANPDRFRSLATTAALRIMRYYTNMNASAMSLNYENGSWILYQLHSFFLFTQNTTFLPVVEQLMSQTLFEPTYPLTFSLDDKTLLTDPFFSRLGNLLYIGSKTLNDQDLASLLKKYKKGLKTLTPFSATAQSHGFGINWNRAWTYAALAARPTVSKKLKKQLEIAFDAVVAEGLADYAANETDYKYYAHWVPQFAVYALTEQLVGDP